MTKEAYFYIMSQKDFKEREMEELEKLLILPNDKEMLRGNRD
jgi:hypothetical protein